MISFHQSLLRNYFLLTRTRNAFPSQNNWIKWVIPDLKECKLDKRNSYCLGSRWDIRDFSECCFLQNHNLKEMKFKWWSVRKSGKPRRIQRIKKTKRRRRWRRRRRWKIGKGQSQRRRRQGQSREDKEKEDDEQEDEDDEKRKEIKQKWKKRAKEEMQEDVMTTTVIKGPLDILYYTEIRPPLAPKVTLSRLKSP